MKITQTVISVMLLCSVLSGAAFAFDPIFINFQAGPLNSKSHPVTVTPAGYIGDIGEAYGDRGNGYTYGWDQDIQSDARGDGSWPADVRYDTFVHFAKDNPRTWEIALTNGTYTIDLYCGDHGFFDQTNSVSVEGVALTDPDGQIDTLVVGDFDEWLEVYVAVSDGKLTITAAEPPADNAKIQFIDINTYIPIESDPPTPNPATFASAPAADSDTAISMTATTGDDASGLVEYYFTATDGGNDSGWQTSVTYTDSGLAPDTTYTYTVTMRDRYDNTGSASTPADATTDTDINPPTPDPATFAIAPAADSGSAISMTATTGSDASGPVEYYFTATDGGNDSG